MNFPFISSADLAHSLEITDDGTEHPSTSPTSCKAADLLELANKLRNMPPVQPADSWLHQSKQRLMLRFDESYQGGERRSALAFLDPADFPELATL